MRRSWHWATSATNSNCFLRSSSRYSPITQNIEELLNDPVAFYRKSSIDVLMMICKKLEFFQKEPFVMLLVNKIGDADKMITQIVQKDIAVAIKVQLG